MGGALHSNTKSLTAGGRGRGHAPDTAEAAPKKSRASIDVSRLMHCDAPLEHRALAGSCGPWLERGGMV